MSDEIKDTKNDELKTQAATDSELKAQAASGDKDTSMEEQTIVPPQTLVKGRRNARKVSVEAVEDDETEDEDEELDDEDFGTALKEAIQEQAREDEPTLTSNITLRKILGGDFLTASMIRRQIGIILIIVAFTIVYISNRYSCQHNLLEIDRLNKELQDAKYKALSSSSALTEKCRESHVLDMLKANNDSLLHIADQPPYIIYVPE